MITIRKRLIFWLIKAYIKKMGKRILLYFAIGLIIFFLLKGSLPHIMIKSQSYDTNTIGMVGVYTADKLPQSILEKVSRGLIAVNRDGSPKPDVAKSWKIENSGKTYIFYLNKDVYFTDSSNLVSDFVNYDFTDVKVERLDKYTIIFKLKESYSPFLITVSKPIFKKGLVGVGEYKIKNIQLNGNFVDSIDLISKDKKKKLIYQFYPSFNALKSAFVIADVFKIIDAPDVFYKNTSFYKFKNAYVYKKVNYKQLVTLFYNTKDKSLSSKTLREALHYSIPDKFENGERSYSPFAPKSFVSDGILNFNRQDLPHAKLLIEKFKTEIPNANLDITIHALSKYKNAAELIKKVWNDLGVKTKIQVTDKIPDNFNVFLGEFFLSPDPDQYVLWHSDQESNISRYSNLRIDKILEDGRQTTQIETRKKIYADFLKYFFADPPASFLFFPYVYDVERKQF